jgi:peptidyl-prolyl cis-trans isomerase SurA
MNKITTGILGFCLSLGALNQAMAQTRELGTSGEMLDGIVALVDSGVVLKSELAERMQVVADNFLQTQMQLPPDQRSQLPPISILEQQVLDQLILEEIQVQRANTIGIQIGDDELNRVLADVAQGVGTTLEGLPDWFASQGIDYPTFRENQRRELKIRQLERREVFERVSINPRELSQCLARAIASQTDEFEYNISHILVSFSADANADEVAAAEAKIRDIARQLDEGADFAQLAVAYSESQTALEGGSLGWRQGSALPTIFADDVRRMSPGEHSTPIRGGGGFHIVRLNELRGAEPQLVDQIHARHILLAPTEVLDSDATQQKLRGIYDQIAGGDDFATVAAAVSDDTASAVDGGDLGWTTYDAFVPEFSEQLRGLEIGELSEPFRTPYGWHIAQVTDKRTYDLTDDLRENECQNQIGNGKVVEDGELWRRRIRDESYVVKRL